MIPPNVRSAILALAVLALGGVPSPLRAQQTQAFIAATDFFTGSLASITLGPPRVATPDVASISSDPVVRWYGGLVYVVNRFNHDNIQVLDPANGFQVVRQFSVGNGANPHDIEFVSVNKAYVTRYELADLLVVDPSTGAALDSISLAGFADADGIPEMDHLALRGTRLFVTIERLDRNNFFLPAGGSLVAVIDTRTNSLIDAAPGTPGVQGIVLPFQNPFTELVVDPAGLLVVGCSGSFGGLDGGIVRIDPVSYAVGTEITESALGGDVNDAATLDATNGFAVVSDADFNTSLKSYRRDLGTSQTMMTTLGFRIGDIEINDRSELWLCDRTLANPGIRIFDASTRIQLTGAPISTGLPPFDIAFDFAPSLVAVPGATTLAPPGLALGPVTPNPSRGPVRFSIRPGGDATPWEGAVDIDVVDVSGRRWWSASLLAAPAGARDIVWDGRAPDGRGAPSGVYFVRARSSAGAASRWFVRLD